jgi:putative ATP-dependent endonuclease of OLD family
MHLSRLHVANFRVFSDLELVLNPGLNLIVGENNSGKTALIDAIRYALDTNSTEWTRVYESDFRRGQNKFSIQLKFDDILPRQARAFVEHLTHEELQNGHRRSVLYVNFSAELTDLVTRSGRYIHTESRSGQMGEGPKFEREARAYLSATYLKPLRDAEGELTATRGSRLSQILQSTKKCREATNVESLLSTLIEANKGILENEGIKEGVKQISRHLRRLSFSTQQFSPLVEIAGGDDSSSLSDMEKKQMFRAVLEKLQLLMDKQERHQGLGFNNLLFMATELLLLEQEPDDFSLLLIEEPEAHLHPQLQMKFLKAIAEDSTPTAKPRLQSVLTTHSPNLASKAPLESVIIMAQARAFPLRSGETELEPHNYVFLEKFLDVTKSNLFFAKGVIIVEGDAESILLPSVADLLGKPLEDYGVSVVNVRGTAFSHYAKIFQRKGLSDASNSPRWLPIKAVCLRDLDLWPERALKQNDADEIGFKVRKPRSERGQGGNLGNWLSSYSAEGLQEYKEGRVKFGGQHVHVEISDAWTFEYCLALQGLAKELHEAASGGTKGFDELPADPEERALKIYRMIDSDEGGKTETAYRLAGILVRDYGVQDAPVEKESEAEATARREETVRRREVKRRELRSKLPPYIVRALEYVTGPDASAPQSEAIGSAEPAGNA